MSRYRRRRRRPASSNGVGIVCALAGAALVAVMGVTVLGEKPPVRPTAVPVKASAPIIRPQPRTSPAPKPRVLTAMQRWEKAIRDVERDMPALRKATRGEGFETLRVDLLSRAADTRDDVGTYLDTHPSDNRANRLWDRVLRAYVALKKL